MRISPIIIDDQQKGMYPDLATDFRLCSTQGLPCVVDVWKNISIYGTFIF
jgi:hypothetical protein